MGHWLQRNIVEPGKLPLLLALTAFVLTFLTTRVITRLIRAGKGPFGNVKSGGLHIHHVVPGVILIVGGGFGAVASGRHGVGAAVCAVLFGMGAGLVLDEFALILHLDDVYWTEEGRKSVEVVVLTFAVVGLVLVGFSPFGVNDVSQDEAEGRGSVISTVALNFLFALAVLSKGKVRMAIFSVIVPFVGLIGLVRLARPGSPWARHFYRRRPRARAKAALRAYRHDRRWSRPRRALEDWLGGKPDASPEVEAALEAGRGPSPGAGASSEVRRDASRAAGRDTSPGDEPGASPDRR